MPEGSQKLPKRWWWGGVSELDIKRKGRFETKQVEGWGTEGAELGEYRTLQKGNQRTDIAKHELRPHPGSSCLEHSISDFKKKNM